jgi:CheY-like chemotaxis protein
LRRLGPDRRAVLVVEDNAEMARLLSRMVRSVSRRYQVSVAGNGEQALTLMREQRPDVVLLDLVLPTLDGYGVLEAMRADPGLDAIPVIVITAKGAHTEAVMAHQVSLTKKDGLTVAELMRWLSSGLDALAAPGTTVPTSRAVPAV